MRNRLWIFVGVFSFLFFGDLSLRGQNQDDSGQEVCEPQQKDLQMCLSAVNQEEPLGARIPVILIHGLEPQYVPGPPDISVWSRLVNHLH